MVITQISIYPGQLVAAVLEEKVLLVRFEEVDMVVLSVELKG